MQETQVQSLGWEDLPEKEMATHSSTVVWKIPWMEEPGRLQSMGSQRVRPDWTTSLSLFFHVKWKGLTFHQELKGENREMEERQYFGSSVQFSLVAQLCPTLQSHGLQHARPPCPSPTAGLYPNPCPLSRWCHPSISSSVVPFSSCPQSFPASGSFQMSQVMTAIFLEPMTNINIHVQTWIYIQGACEGFHTYLKCSKTGAYQRKRDSLVDWKKCTAWELWVKFYLGQNED